MARLYICYMRIFSLILSILVSLCAGYSQEVYSLEECIEIAWKNNLQVKQSELNLEASESKLNASRASMLPNVNGFANHNYNWGQRIDPFTNLFATSRVQSNTFNLSSSISLFSGFQIQENIKAQEAGYAASRFGLESQKNNIALNVSSAYLKIVLVEELIVSAEQQVNITKRQL